MKRLTRSSSDRVLGGVCGGIGDYLGVDPNLIRVAWIAFSLFGGAGILTYLAALVIVPSDGTSSGEAQSFDLGRVDGLAAIVAGFVLMFRGLDLPVHRMPSGAFHDASFVSGICPTGMIFIPCLDGVSHHESEYASPEDCAAGAQVLASVLQTLANR